MPGVVMAPRGGRTVGRRQHGQVALGLDHCRVGHWMRCGGHRARALGHLANREEEEGEQGKA
jgi:hypothetical protein